MRAPVLFFCFSRRSEATSHTCSGVHPQGQERVPGMQVRMSVISYIRTSTAICAYEIVVYDVSVLVRVHILPCRIIVSLLSRLRH